VSRGAGGGTRTSPMTIRVLTHSPPAPGISGDRIRTFHLVRELRRRGWSVRLWSLVADDEPAGFRDALDEIADEVVLVPRRRSTARRLFQVALDTISGRAFQANWFRSRATQRAAADWLHDTEAEPLLVQQLYMYSFVPPQFLGQVLLDTHNNETARLVAMSRGEAGLMRRTAARLQVDAVGRYEQAALKSVASVLAVSPDEASAFEPFAPGRVHVVPNGVDVGEILPMSSPPASRQMLYVGSMGYSANRDAVRYACEAIAPLLRGSGASLTVVGSGATREVLKTTSRAEIPVTVTGFVPDLAPHIAASRVMVVPLRHGAGTRLKILEGLAWGLPIVTTSLGCAGLDVINRVHVLIADDPRSFADAVESILGDDGLWRRLSYAGRALVEERYAWERIGDSMDAAARELVPAVNGAVGAGAHLPR